MKKLMIWQGCKMNNSINFQKYNQFFTVPIFIATLFLVSCTPQGNNIIEEPMEKFQYKEDMDITKVDILDYGVYLSYEDNESNPSRTIKEDSIAPTNRTGSNVFFGQISPYIMLK